MLPDIQNGVCMLIISSSGCRTDYKTSQELFSYDLLFVSDPVGLTLILHLLILMIINSATYFTHHSFLLNVEYEQFHL